MTHNMIVSCCESIKMLKGMESFKDKNDEL